jgi:hypothetical protein
VHSDDRIENNLMSPHNRLHTARTHVQKLEQRVRERRGGERVLFGALCTEHGQRPERSVGGTAKRANERVRVRPRVWGRISITKRGIEKRLTLHIKYGENIIQFAVVKRMGRPILNI